MRVRRLHEGGEDVMEEAMASDERWEESSDCSSNSDGDHHSKREPMDWCWDDFNCREDSSDDDQRRGDEQDAGEEEEEEEDLSGDSKSEDEE